MAPRKQWRPTGGHPVPLSVRFKALASAQSALGLTPLRLKETGTVAIRRITIGESLMNR